MIINTQIKGGGTTPTGTLPITNNGIYDVTNYATADVNVSGGGGVGIPREVVSGVYRRPQSSYTFTLPNDATSIYTNALSRSFNYTDTSGDDNIVGVDFNNVTEIMEYACPYCWSNCSNLATVTATKVKVLGDFAFNNAFKYTAVTSVTFTALDTVGYRSFYQAFAYCTNLTDIYFPAITTTSFTNSSSDPFYQMLRGTSAGITVHFPSNVQSVVEALTGYSATNPWNASNGGSVLFDLPATS